MSQKDAVGVFSSACHGLLEGRSGVPILSVAAM